MLHLQQYNLNIGLEQYWVTSFVIGIDVDEEELSVTIIYIASS